MPHGHFLRIGQPILWIDDPHNCPDGRDVLTILESTCEALVRRGPDLRFVPALAQSWQVSGDGRTWTFQLVDRPHFSNGEPFDSEAVRYAIERMIRPDKGTSTLGGPAVWRSYLDGVEVKPVGRREINVITPEPLADLLDILANAYVLRPDDPGGEPGQAAEPRYIGAGPYRLVEYEPGSHAIAEANPFYHGVPPRLKRVEWRLIADPTERTEALLRQEIDVAVALTVAESARLDGMAGMRTKACAGTTAVVYLFNLLQPGPLQNVAVRCALNLAVDREAIIRDVLNGAGDPLRGIVSSYHVGFDPSAPPFHYDPSAAKRLLAEAEYPFGPSLTFDTPLEMPDHHAGKRGGDRALR